MMKNWRLLNKDCKIKQAQLLEEHFNILIDFEAYKDGWYQYDWKKSGKS